MPSIAPMRSLTASSGRAAVLLALIVITAHAKPLLASSEESDDGMSIAKLPPPIFIAGFMKCMFSDLSTFVSTMRFSDSNGEKGRWSSSA